jgi:tricorn protease-like protein
MYPQRRGVYRISLLIFASALIPGCLEYNPRQPVDETECLSGIIQLTDGFDRAGEAVVSRDQRWMMFRAKPAPVQAKSAESLQLYLAKLNWNASDLVGTERPIRITPVGSVNQVGGFSPAAESSLIFSSALRQSKTSGKFPINMRIYRFDGWEGALSLADASTGIDMAEHPLTVDRAYTGECSHSPDGKWICFTSTRGGHPNLYVMHADGSHITQLTRTAGYDGAAVFSPDGRQILYQSDRDASHLMQIFVADLSFDSGGEITGIIGERQLTSEDNNSNPAWNPDGLHIVYSTSRQGRNNYEIYLMNKLGRRKTRITFFAGADLFPVFSPDGKYLLWSSKRSRDGTVQVFAAKFQMPRGS